MNRNKTKSPYSPCTKSIYFDADVLRAATFKHLKIITLTKYMIIFSDVLRAINRVWVIKRECQEGRKGGVEGRGGRKEGREEGMEGRDGGKGRRERVEGKGGRKGWRERMEGKGGGKGWRERVEGKGGRKGWKGTKKHRPYGFIRSVFTKPLISCINSTDARDFLFISSEASGASAAAR